MRLAVFGASGATGRELVSQALTGGHRVVAFVRRPDKLHATNGQPEIVVGDVVDPAAVERAIAGCDAVLSALGVGRRLHHDPAVIQGVRNIVRSMERHGPRRLIYLSFLGVKESRHQLGFILGQIAARFIVRNEVADHEEKEAIIRGSGLEWTIVRPPGLTNGPRTGAYRSGGDIRARSLVPSISRKDLAEFLLAQIDDLTYVRRAVAVMH